MDLPFSLWDWAIRQSVCLLGFSTGCLILLAEFFVRLFIEPLNLGFAQLFQSVFQGFHSFPTGKNRKSFVSLTAFPKILCPISLRQYITSFGCATPL